MKINDPDYRLSNDELQGLILIYSERIVSYGGLIQSYSPATIDAFEQQYSEAVGAFFAMRDLQRLRQTIAAAQFILDADRGSEIEIGASYAVLTTHYSATNEAEVGGAETWFDALAALVKEPPGDGGNHE